MPLLPPSLPTLCARHLPHLTATAEPSYASGSLILVTRICAETILLQISPHLGCNPPGVSGGIFYTTPTVRFTFTLARFLDGDATRLEGAPVGCIDVGHVNMQPDWKGWILVACLRDHYNRIVNLHF